MALSANPQYPVVNTDTYSPDGLIAGFNIGVVTQTATLLAGQNLARGAVLGKITASGKYILSLSAAVDGSQTPVAILAEAANAVSDKLVTIYQAGEFNSNALTFGTGHSATTQVTLIALNDAAIYLKTPPLGF